MAHWISSTCNFTKSDILMASEGLMQAIFRQQKRKYLSSLHSSPEKRVEARHRYLMLKEMPYRDSNGRALTMFHLTSLQIQHMHPPHNRPLQPKSHHSSHHSLALSPPVQSSSRKQSVPRYSRRRGRKLDYLISRCEESLSSSPERSQRGKRRESMPSRV